MGAVSEAGGAAVDYSLELVVQVLGHDFNVASNAANNGSSFPGCFVHFWGDVELRKSPRLGEASVKALKVIRGEHFSTEFN